MLTKNEFWLLTLLAVAAAVFALGNMVLYQGNRKAQVEVTSRQQYIQQSIQLQVFYTEMVKALADLAVRNRDPEIANLLSAQGISITPSPSGSAPADAAKNEGAK